METYISKKILIELLMKNWKPNMKFDDLLKLISKAEEETKEKTKS